MPNTEFELIETVKNTENIIVYGAADTAMVVTKCLITNGFYSKIHIAVTDNIQYKTIEARLLNFNIQNIQDLLHIAKNSIVLIATSIPFHDEIEDNLNSLGFAKKIRINEILIKDLSNRHSISHENYMEKQEYLNYRMMNIIKLNHLRNKVRDNRKIKVIFLLTSKAEFNFASVYRNMESKKIFEVSIFVSSKLDTIPEKGQQEIYDDGLYDYCMGLKKLGFNVIWGYDEENQQIPIDLFSPDIIFYNKHQKNSIHSKLIDYLACYIPYGFHIATNFHWHFENPNILPAWIHFIDFRQAYNLCKKKSPNSLNAVLSGHPLFDDYERELETGAFKKIINRKKIVIYAPHWSMPWYIKNMRNDVSGFHIYFKYFINLLKKYPDVNFVFKPHPLIKLALNVAKSPITLSEYDEYCKAWNDAPNGLVVTDSNYIDLFRISDCLITDSYSFLMTWLPTEKPCIMPITNLPQKELLKRYYDFIHPLIDTYYIARNENELDAIFKDIIEGKDVKVEERKKVKKQLLYNFGKAGQFIADYVERQLLN